jgi:hypothetical protein
MRFNLFTTPTFMIALDILVIVAVILAMVNTKKGD